MMSNHRFPNQRRERRAQARESIRRGQFPKLSGELATEAASYGETTTPPEVFQRWHAGLQTVVIKRIVFPALAGYGTVAFETDMKLDEVQRKTVAGWIEQGLKLSEIQSKISQELGVSMTYMDVRFLIDDLKLQPKDAQPVATAVIGSPTPGPAPGTAPAPSLAPEPEEEAAGPGGVSVTVDQVTRPGAMISGRVKFSDGQGGAWLIDQMGRPGLVTDQQGYRPSQADIAEFQVQLQNELARLGF